MAESVDTEHGHTPAALEAASQACQEDSSRANDWYPLRLLDVSIQSIYLAPSNDSPTVKACLERFATITRNLQLRD